jgi:hypothetical protein
VITHREVIARTQKPHTNCQVMTEAQMKRKMVITIQGRRKVQRMNVSAINLSNLKELCNENFLMNPFLNDFPNLDLPL